MTNRIPTDELLTDLQRVAESIENSPSINEYRDRGQYSPGTLKNRFGSWNEALEAAGYEPNVVQSVTEQELLEDLKQTANRLDTVPTIDDQESYGTFCSDTFKNKFGSWNEALKEAGYKPNLRKDITDDELLDDLRHVGDALGDSPTVAQYESEGSFSRKTLSNRFGSWNEALKRAGYRLHNHVPREDLLADLERVCNSLDRVPTADDYTVHGKYSVRLISDRFGSWNDALKESGYELHSPYKITCRELLDDLKQVGDSISGAPTMEEYNSTGVYSTRPFYNFFSSWSDALESAGFEPNLRQNIPDSELLMDLERVANLLNKPPTIVEYDLHGEYSSSTLSDSFETWNKALKAAGYQPNVVRDVASEVLLADLQQVGDLIESTPTMADYDVYGDYGSATLTRRFGSWNDALDKAGYQPNLRRDISDKELLADLHHVAEIVNGTPTAQNHRDYGQFSAKCLEDRFGSWNNALKTAGLRLNTHIPSDDLISDLSEAADGPLAPSRDEYSQTGKYHAATIRSKLNSWWVACVKAGFKPLARRPLCPEASHRYHRTAVNLPTAETAFYALLFQFTGLSPAIAIHLRADWIANRRRRCIIRVPREYTVTGRSWVFRVPDTWENPYTGDEEPTYLPRLFEWYTTHYTEVPMQTYGSLQKIPLRIAEKADLGKFRRTINHSALGTVPEVRPQDLRATLGVNLAREGTLGEDINNHVGINQTAWQADVDDFFVWLHEREDSQHPEYSPEVNG